MLAIIDSGVGGLSCLREFLRTQPQLSFVYHADSAFAPYGDKSVDFLKKRVPAILQYLFEHYPITSLCVACNTSATQIMPQILQTCALHQVQCTSILDGVTSLFTTTKSTLLGVLATQSTVQSGVYNQIAGQFDKTVIQEACPEFVPYIEHGKIDSLNLRSAISKHMNNVLEQSHNVHEIVLGCTHFPFLRSVFEELYPNILFLDPATYLTALQSTNSNQQLFLTSGDTTNFEHRVFELVGKKITAQHTHITT